MNGIFWVLDKIGIPNIGLAIIIFTIVIYLLLMPFTIKQQKFSKLRHIGEKEPPLCTIRKYDISPEIPRDEISVNDRSKPEKPRGILAPRGKAASAIGIIGGADGPTVIVTSSASGRTACSSLYYEPEYEPDWCMVFYNKPKEDIEIELI